MKPSGSRHGNTKSCYISHSLPGNNYSRQRGPTQRDQRWACPFQAETKKSLEKKKSWMELPEKWRVLEGKFKDFVFSRKKKLYYIISLELSSKYKHFVH